MRFKSGLVAMTVLLSVLAGGCTTTRGRIASYQFQGAVIDNLAGGPFGDYQQRLAEDRARNSRVSLKAFSWHDNGDGNVDERELKELNGNPVNLDQTGLYVILTGEGSPEYTVFDDSGTMTHRVNQRSIALPRGFPGIKRGKTTFRAQRGNEYPHRVDVDIK